MEDRLRGARGVVVTRFNYHRPKWFGGFFGFAKNHNTPGNVKYEAESLSSIINADGLNEMVEPIYEMTPVLAYHLAISIFIGLSLLLTAMQQGYNVLLQFGIVSSAHASWEYFRVIGVIWYITWGLGLLAIVPLYYVALNNIERFFVENGNSLPVNVSINKNPPSKFLLIPGFKKIDWLEISPK